ncbi:MAG: DUF3224 domain-containing protein [Gemmatimonadaceae bacterium]|nr:DUF3224 domain-containing protein [Gemmatimonadaceae bacterium]
MTRFTDIPNVGPATARDFELLGLADPAALVGLDAYSLHAELERRSGTRQDPCMIDVFLAAIDYMEGAPPRPWWHYTPRRKAHLATRGLPRGVRAVLLAGLALPSCLARTAATVPASSAAPATALAPTSTGARMSVRASGTFEVKLVPQPADAHADGAAMGRMTIDKTFSGDLVATSVGQMLTGMGGVKGSATYVAIERVTGTLGGRRGSFLLAHRGTMARGAQSLEVQVVPDSGTDELTGLTGSMAIEVTPGRHAYTFDYVLPPRG